MEGSTVASDLAQIASATVDMPLATAEAGPAEPAAAAGPAASDAGIQIACHIVPNLGISAAAQPSLAMPDVLPTAEASIVAGGASLAAVRRTPAPHTPNSLPVPRAKHTPCHTPCGATPSCLKRRSGV